jgi:hypothetical protein
MEMRSAKIYQFPVGGRRGVAGIREATAPVTYTAESSMASVACEGAWYHEEAIQAELGRRNPYRLPTR